MLQDIDLKILREVVEYPEVGYYVKDSYIAEKLGLDIEQVADHLAMLDEDGYVKLSRTCDGCSADSTHRGRLMIKESEYMSKRLTGLSGPVMIQVLIDAVEKDERIPKPDKKSIIDKLNNLIDNQYVSGLSTSAIFEIAKSILGF